MDVCDRAQQLEEQARAALIARAGSPASNVSSLTHCAECGDRIPEARRQAIAGCTLCTACQAEQENQR